MWPLSNGGGFNNYSQWMKGHPIDSATPLLGDVTGDKTSDAVAVFNGTGSWKVLRGEGPNEPNFENLWASWDIPYTPNSGIVEQLYDSGDPETIDRHLQMIANAGFRFLLFDLTNNVNTDFIKVRALEVCRRIQLFNSRRRPEEHLKFAVAVGGIQFTKPVLPKVLEDEADSVWTDFVNEFSSDYFKWKGKPLLVAYMDASQRSAWAAYKNHQSTDRFHIGNAQGIVESSNEAGFFGWGLKATIPHPEVMGVMPGWQNKYDAFVSRKKGAFFNKGWQAVINQQPELVIVNSFNEFAEETGVEPAESRGGIGRRAAKEPWTDWYGEPVKDWFWTMTIQWNHLYQYGCFLDGTYAREVNASDVYRYAAKSTSFIYQESLPHGQPILEVPAGWLERGKVCPTSSERIRDWKSGGLGSS